MIHGLSLSAGLLTLAVTGRAFAQCQVQKLAPDGLEAEDNFGWSAALGGETLALGSPGDDERGDTAGAAYPYVRCCGDTWAPLGKITASDGQPFDAFGYDTDAHGDRIVAGAAFHGFAGVAYVFERDADNWVQRAKLIPTGIGVNTGFGLSVAVHGDVVVGGAIHDNPRGLSSGSAFVFERQKDGTWLQVAKLFPNDGAITDAFGLAVDASAETIVGGALNHDARGDNAGAAYVFERCGDRCWTQTAKLLACDGGDNDNFGSAVAISGDVILVGADGFDGDRGKAYVFERSPATGKWVEVAILFPSDGGPKDHNFGEAVDLQDDVALISAWGDDDIGPFAGAAYVFRRDPDARWVEEVKLTADDGEAEDVLGRSGVAVHERTAVVGATGDDDNGSNAGSAYVFRLSLPPRPGDLDCDGTVDFADLLELLAAWGPVPDCPPSIPADIDGDCDVDLGDLLILLANWG